MCRKQELTFLGLVLLIMILACIGQRAAKSASNTSTTSGFSIAHTEASKLQAVYIVSSHPFPEVDEFVESSATDYHLDVVRYQLAMKKGLESYLAEKKSVKAIFVGTRRTDPHGESLTHFDPTDSGWPPFMRIHPVIDWHYGMLGPRGRICESAKKTPWLTIYHS
jgi:FAD synthetase